MRRQIHPTNALYPVSKLRRGLRIARWRQNWVLHFLLVYVAGLVAVTARLMQWLCLRERMHVPNSPVILTAPLIVVILIAALIVCTIKVSLQNSRLVQHVQDWRHIEGTGILIDALDISHRRIDRAAQSTLAYLLPRLRLSDTGLLLPRHLARLCYVLENASTPQPTSRDYLEREELRRAFVFAIIKAAPIIGNADMLRVLRRLAHDPTDLCSVSAQIAAEQLSARLESEQNSASLLRGSQADAATSTTLLRPVQATAVEDTPQTLLRAGAPPNE